MFCNLVLKGRTKSGRFEVTTSQLCFDFDLWPAFISAVMLRIKGPELGSWFELISYSVLGPKIQLIRPTLIVSDETFKT